MHEVKVSLCSQVKNRLHQLRLTWDRNITIIDQDPLVEWVIVDMGSEDGLQDFMRERKHPKVLYHRCLDDMPYSIPVAKNFAARLSSGGYLFNLDIDNFVDDALETIRGSGYQPLCCMTMRKGVFGRIGCAREVFQRAGGYDESFLPAGQHEQDFMERCALMGVRFSHVDHRSEPIQNQKGDTIANMSLSMPWEEMNKINKGKKLLNLSEGRVNPNRKHRRARFERNFVDEVTLGEDF